MFISVKGLVAFSDRIFAKNLKNGLLAAKNRHYYSRGSHYCLHTLQHPHPSHTKMPPKAAPAHPKYEDMVKAAIVALKDRNGSSVPAITKYLGANFKLPENFKKILSTQLKNLVKSGKLLKVKASYKLGEALKKKPPKKKAPKKKAPKKKAKKAKKPKAKKAPKKKAAKKTASKAKKPKAKAKPKAKPKAKKAKK